MLFYNGTNTNGWQYSLNMLKTKWYKKKTFADFEDESTSSTVPGIDNGKSYDTQNKRHQHQLVLHNINCFKDIVCDAAFYVRVI